MTNPGTLTIWPAPTAAKPALSPLTSRDLRAFKALDASVATTPAPLVGAGRIRPRRDVPMVRSSQFSDITDDQPALELARPVPRPQASVAARPLTARKPSFLDGKRVPLLLAVLALAGLGVGLVTRGATAQRALAGAVAALPLPGKAREVSFQVTPADASLFLNGEPLRWWSTAPPWSTPPLPTRLRIRRPTRRRTPRPIRPPTPRPIRHPPAARRCRR